MISLTAAATAGVFIPSSSAPSTPLTSPSVPVLAYAPVNVGTDYGITSLVSAPMPSTTSPAPGSPGQSGLSASTKRMILIVGIFSAAMLTLFIVFMSTCLRRRRREKQRRKWEQASVEWGRSTPKQAAPRQYTPPSSWASDTAPRAVAPVHRPSSPQKYPRPPAQYSGLRSPSSATPLISPPPQAVTRLRSPLANGHVLVAEPGSPSPVTPAFSLPPLSPAPLSPLPQTPNSPSGSSAASCGLVPPTPSLGYGWTRPSLVGIHPFSQSSSSAAAEASSSSSAARTERAGSGAGAGANLGPSMNEKSAAALFQLTRGDAPQALHSAPAYREKDGEMQPRARADSESAPPLYEP
ncbi:unnamed protein product [Mycena citricolor]|nr:unnamed protein product [Mycena citricolor]CAK5271700.1 unnamed protein product [Mycena citricolor]